MSEYIEKKGKLILEVTNSVNPVNIKIDCQYGTISKVSFFHQQLKTAGCGETKIIGSAQELKGKTIEFNGSSGNPGGEQITIIHTISEQGGKQLIYTFPNDYTGSPNFDGSDKEPSYVFYIKFV